MSSQIDILVAGGGIGGLATALASARAGHRVRLFERAPVFSEVGAGIQISPNVVRVLQSWGLGEALQSVAAFPDRLQVRSALSGRHLGQLTLAGRAEALYGAPYATIHRADLHQLLLTAVQAQADVSLQLNTPVAVAEVGPEGVSLKTGPQKYVEGDVLVGADGLWSGVRQALLGVQPPRVTGHLAFRAMLPQARFPAALRSSSVTAWLGPDLHVVAYPVRAGEWLNVVAIVHGEVQGDLSNWDHGSNASQLLAVLADCCSPLQDLVRAVPEWRLWALCDRPPLSRPEEMAQGRIALLGDAAHPMRPYLAQGAGMALEDAHALTLALAQEALDLPTRLRRYALNRWQRCARVQARAERNGRVFHATGPLQWGRDAAMGLLGEGLLDVPWLYAGDPLNPLPAAHPQ
ncbi:FAD-dependent monooxygenase [Curvibacter sp. HBC28]|uniref:FAD-dependent monooxygenase n=1 Tax=Curvibacter microcysteis TaxID=3026419 RepID=A0ABT5MGF0_9BURK|nr:FAD-dependent monooxygenase [Curvibacter sp. HBC28]MDD0815666.1 FAD-dependent monooxygenase [Curvibacter sp. HBC28]